MELKVISTGSKGNSYLLKPEKGQAILIECGITFKELKIGLDYNIGQLSGCLVTHEHLDHSKCMNELISSGINVYTSMGTASKMSGILSPKIIEALEHFTIGDFIILPFKVEHDAAEPLGFYIQHPECGNIVFATDTKSLNYKFPNINHWIIESNYSEKYLRMAIEEHKTQSFLANRIYENHMSLETCIKILEENDLSKTKTITLIHLSQAHGDGSHFQTEVSRAIGIKPEIAKKGLIVNLY